MLRHFFLPHPDSHKKAHLLSWQALVLYIIFFIFLQTSFSILSYVKPGVLGTSSSINQKLLIELTNKERGRLNLPQLSENEKLDQAAHAKAQNMFAEGYWAHFAPSGKDPWGFIIGSGYRFSFAGENLAKNFQASEDVVSAWMASPSHKDNIVNARYKDIGIAVVDGVLNGESTTLVVQMFGTPVESIAVFPVNTPAPAKEQPVINLGGQEVALAEEQTKSVPVLIAEQPRTAGTTLTNPLIDSFMVTRVLGGMFLMTLAILLMIDLYIIRRRGVLRITSRHLPHIAMLGVSIGALLSMKPGAIL